MGVKPVTDERRRLRSHAEEVVAHGAKAAAAADRPTSSLVHELQVHQIELEMQNEELRRSQVALEEAHASHVELYDFAPVGYLTLDGAGLVARANLAAASLLGVERTNLVGRPFARFVERADADRWHLFLTSLPRGGSQQECELALQLHDGSVFDAHLACQSNPGDGSAPLVRVLLTDITERRRAEEALRASEAKFRNYVKRAPVGLFVVDGLGRYLDSNPAGLEMLGFDATSVRSMAFADLLDDAALDGAPHDIATLASTPTVEQEVRLVRPDGRTLWITLNATSIAEDRFLAFCQDITERKLAEEALRESQARFREVIDTLPALVWTIRPDGFVADCNRTWCEFTGMTREQSLGNGWMAALHPDDRATTGAAVADAFATGKPYQVEQRLRRHDGEFRWFLVRGHPVRDSTGKVVHWHGANVDIHDRKLAEEALLASEERYRSVVTNMTEGVVVRDADGVVTACNPAADRIFGLGGHEWPAIHEDGSPFAIGEHPATAALRSGHSQLNVVMGFQKPDGVLTWVKNNSELLRDPHGRIVGVVSTMADITERRALREQLTVSARLAGMATLVAGVAHEINNPLAGEMSSHATAIQEVQTLAGLLRAGDRLDREALARRADEVVEMLGDAQVGSRRIARIVKDLSAIGRSSPERAPIRLSAVVESAMQWLPALVGHGVTIRVEVKGAPQVLAAEGQIEQVVTNLAINGSLAIPAGRQGEITIRIGPGTSGMARLEVEDNGAGIAPDILGRIFDPFFTTRDVGKGMGLGLSICHAIVTAHGGTLTVTSEVGKGSMFRVELPAMQAARIDGRRP
jgi:PAS domain S-box-containing protein